MKRKPYTYISLFSNAGIGCYGFKQAGFECVATNELLEERIRIQKFNNKCKYASGYICGDITLDQTKKKIYDEIDLWVKKESISGIDTIIATPPCQGMSVANHKKKDELSRNSLIVESLVITETIQPRFFVFENVRSFLKAICTDTDGNLKSIKESIEFHLGNYNIHYDIINFKDFGNPSNRTRSLVLGVRKDLIDVTPYDIFPDYEAAPTLRQSIGHFQKLDLMGAIDPKDIFHNFRPYPAHMEDWVRDIREGQSAFDQEEISKRPHRVVDGSIVENIRKNGDKYSRCYWDKPGFCIHTRNDQLASQNTVHPEQNRVFSIREVMTLMSVPYDFHWTDVSLNELNALSYAEKRKFLKNNELNIRRTLGEAVPTLIFRKIATRIRKVLHRPQLQNKDIDRLTESENLLDFDRLYSYLEGNFDRHSFEELSKIAELANAKRFHNAAYYTSQDICYTVIKDLPDFANKDDITILEPSVGMGNFIPLLLKKYQEKKHVTIDMVDIDANSIRLLKLLLKKLTIPKNVSLNFINKDFLSDETCYCKQYDLVIGNPPFKKITKQKERLAHYKKDMYNQKTNNIFSFFIEKSLLLGQYVALILPKTLLSTPEYNRTRELLSRHHIMKICDYGEKAFKIKIETVNLIVRTSLNRNGYKKELTTKVESYITQNTILTGQDHITDTEFPCWLIYRNDFFDTVANRMMFDIFTVFRDRQITNKLLSDKGKYRVLKSRNVESNRTRKLDGYDCFIDKVDNLTVSRFLNKRKIVMLPNLTYNPRGCFLPRNTIVDGSVALAKPINGHKITKTDLNYYATDEFREFYKIARNISTRSMNIDSNAIFFFGIKGGDDRT